MTVYLPRSAWGARPPTGTTLLVPAEVRGLALHWPGMGSRQLITRDQVAQALRGWQDYHMDGRGWSDIAYQVAVDQAGRAWTLRDLPKRSGANGDATVNRQYGAVLLIVGSSEAPTTALVETTRNVVADFRRLYPKGTLIRPHSAVREAGTDCPGNAVRRLIAAGTFQPRSTTTPEVPVTPAQMDELKDYVDDRMSVYSLWQDYRQRLAELTVAQAKNDTIAIKSLTPMVVAARTAWEAKK